MKKNAKTYRESLIARRDLSFPRAVNPENPNLPIKPGVDTRRKSGERKRLGQQEEGARLAVELPKLDQSGAGSWQLREENWGSRLSRRSWAGARLWGARPAFPFSWRSVVTGMCSQNRPRATIHFDDDGCFKVLEIVN